MSAIEQRNEWYGLDEESRAFLAETLAGPSSPSSSASSASSADDAASLDPAPASPLGAGQPGVTLVELLAATIEAGASDLHLSADQCPHVRVQGVLRPLAGTLPLDAGVLDSMLSQHLDQRQRESLAANGDLELALAVGAHRFRSAIFRQRGSLAAALRLVPSATPDLEALGLPPAVKALADLQSGLVLVTGRTGSGKSTTLAAAIEYINRTRAAHIITIEDPVEYRYQPKKSVIQQRQIGSDAQSFASALRSALRQDPDVILLGELRDLDTISTALTAAETGHLVFATLHSSDAAGSISRIIDAFGEAQQPQVRSQLALSLRGCVSQQLVPDRSGRLALISEVLIATSGVRSMIRDDKTHQVHAALEAGGADGMHTFDQSLAGAVRSGRISFEVARSAAHRPSSLDHLLGR